MMRADQTSTTKGAGKNAKAEPSAKKAAKRSRKSARQETAQQEPAQPAASQPEQVEQPQEAVTVAPMAMENPVADTTPDVPATAATAEPEEAVEEAAEPAAMESVRAEHAEAPVSLQTITNAYGDFTRKSIEQTGSFFEQLAGVRSLNRVFELQGEFAQQTFETFVSESRKIRELHSELTMQRLRNLEGFVARMKPTRSS